MKKLITAAFVCTTVFFMSCNSTDNSNPKSVLMSFFDALSKKDIAGARKLATAESKSMWKWQPFPVRFVNGFGMNDEVLNRLQLPTGKTLQVVDLGCGVGTVARYAVKKYNNLHITGTTISDYQLEKGRSLNAKSGLNDEVELIKDNFEESAFPSNYFDFAYALESACHASHSNKELFIAEMARTLKPGGRFCIADGFIKHNKPLPWLFKRINRKITDCWALPCFGNLQEFKAALLQYGLTDIKVEEISMRIAPSVAYVPWTCVKFFVKELWTNKSLKMKKERWNNVIAPVLGMVLGLYRRHFGYYIISGRKETRNKE